MTDLHRRIVLAARPEGEPTASDFRLQEGPVPGIGDGQVLLRTLWLSLDPYMRGRMSAARSYAAPVEIGEVMVGGTVSEVAASNHPRFQTGDVVFGMGGWQSHAVSDGTGLRKLDPGAAPIQTALGVLGMPGMTAYTGLLGIGKPKEGETVAVAAAAGPVGATVGQIAKIKGCRTVGIAGGAEKCRFLTDELGFDAAVDHRNPGFRDALKAACPKASTSTSRTWAARSSTRCCRSSTISPGCPSAASSPSTTPPRSPKGRTAPRCSCATC
jgi:NADPH-dependent curcumin reductase CurA